jgi:rRNA maturation RNase YbeY
MAVNFFTEEIKFELPQKLKRKNWLREIANSESFKIKELNYIFCTDEYLYITFDNSEKEKIIEGDIFISIDRVRENAAKLGQPESHELSRVISHGLFHLMGYKDKSKEEGEKMRAKEEFAIELFENT